MGWTYTNCAGETIIRDGEAVGGFGYDPYDAEWESPNTGRTAYRPGEDDDYCEVCDGTIVTHADGTQVCGCDEQEQAL